MAHFTRVRVDLAAWGYNTGVSQAEFDKFDQLYKAINGDDGGTWAPSSAIVIGGSGLTVDGAFVAYNATVNGAAAFNGNVTLGNSTGDSANVTGHATLNWGFTVTDGAVSFGGQSITEVLGSWQFTYGFTGLGDVVIGASDGTHTMVVRATETHHGTETHNGASTHNGNLTAAGEMIVQGVMTYAGTAPNTIFIDDNALSVNILAYHQYIVRTLTASRSLTLTSAGALRSGTTFRVCNRYTNYSITPVVNGVALTPTGGVGYANEKTYVYDGAAWWGT